MLHVGAETFEVAPSQAAERNSAVGRKPVQIYGKLKSNVTLLESAGTMVALLTSDFPVNRYPFSNLARRRVAAALGIDVDQVLAFSSHNHCCTEILQRRTGHGAPDPDATATENELTDDGRALLAGYVSAAHRCREALVPVGVRYGVGHERRITHNRKGRRADGSTFFMREEHRLQWGVDYNGDIDDDAFVLGFFGDDGKPACFLTQFTGHPVTAYHCEWPIVHGEFPQVACDDLAAAYDGVPVGFLQGCAGDVNSKGLLSHKPAAENVADAERYGHQLGETYQRVAGSLTGSQRDDLALSWRIVELPFRPLPSRAALAQRMEEVHAFMQRCDAGDDAGTRECDGLNFPTNMTPAYRKGLIEPTRRWLEWALAFHDEGRLDEVPTSVALRVAALRIGDVGIVGLPCEPLQGIGRRIKRGSPLALTIPCGYMNDTQVGYVPDGPNCADREYVSSFYRYTTSLLPFAEPAGDALAVAAIDMLSQSLEPQPA